jgi:hypothetical protein
MTGFRKLTLALSLLAVLVPTVGVIEAVTAEQPSTVRHKTVKVATWTSSIAKPARKTLPRFCCYTASRPVRRCSAT